MNHKTDLKPLVTQYTGYAGPFTTPLFPYSDDAILSSSPWGFDGNHQCLGMPFPFAIAAMAVLTNSSQYSYMVSQVKGVEFDLCIASDRSAYILFQYLDPSTSFCYNYVSSRPLEANHHRLFLDPPISPFSGVRSAGFHFIPGVASRNTLYPMVEPSAPYMHAHLRLISIGIVLPIDTLAFQAYRKVDGRIIIESFCPEFDTAVSAFCKFSFGDSPYGYLNIHRDNAPSGTVLIKKLNLSLL